MTVAAPIKSRDFRYRLYFWLMDICTVFIGFGLLEFFVRQITGVRALGMPEPFDTIIGAIVDIFVTVVPAGLIAVKALRDEYAELLWKRAVGILVFLIAVVPLLLAVFLTVAFAVIGGETRPDWLGWLFDDQKPVLILFRSWSLLLILFVIIFQFLRWKDTR